MQVRGFEYGLSGTRLLARGFASRGFAYGVFEVHGLAVRVLFLVLSVPGFRGSGFWVGSFAVQGFWLRGFAGLGFQIRRFRYEVSGFGVSGGSGFRGFRGSGFRCSGFRVVRGFLGTRFHCSGFRVRGFTVRGFQGSWFRVRGVFEVRGLGLGVSRFGVS